MSNGLDTLIKIETPEGVELVLPVAGPIPRAMAWTIDCLIKLGALIAFAFVVPFLGRIGVGIMLLLFFFGLWFYNVFFEVLGNGATPGKRILKLRVTHVNGTPVTWSSSLLRNLIRWIDFLPIYYGFGLTACLMNPRFQRLGDMAAGTLVVHEEKVPVNTKLDSEIAAQAPRIPLALDDQKAIVTFAERAPAINPDRVRELASILNNVVVDPEGDGAKQLVANAKWLKGQQ